MGTSLGPSVVCWLTKWRFIRFSIVGLSGTVVNLIVLYINQELLLGDIQPRETRLTLSVAVAIFFATINNYVWNRRWTWGDRKANRRLGFFIQMGQYFVASGFAMGIQFVFTILLARYTHYLIANILAIIFAALCTYLLNDVWTFSKKKKGEPIRR